MPGIFIDLKKPGFGRKLLAGIGLLGFIDAASEASEGNYESALLSAAGELIPPQLEYGSMLVGTMGDATLTNANTGRMVDMWNQAQNPTMPIEQRVSLLDQIMKYTDHYGFPDRQNGNRILEMRFGLSEFIKSPAPGRPIDKNPISIKAFL
jgi:hypothetical protein